MHNMKLEMLQNVKRMVRAKDNDGKIPSLNAQFGKPILTTGFCMLDDFKLVNPH